MGKTLRRTNVVEQQKQWIRDCGNSLLGYVRHYAKFGVGPEQAEQIYRADQNELDQLLHPRRESHSPRFAW